MSSIHHYEVTGRMKPTERVPVPPVFRMKIFAKNPVLARSKFWYFVSLLKRVKKSNGEIISVSEIFEKNPNQVKNYGFFLRYQSRSGTHNMYKEFRDVTLTAAAGKLYAEMSSQHRARHSCIQIIRTTIVPAKECKRPKTLEFHDSKIAFKLFHRVNRPSHKRFRSVFKAQKANTFF